MRRCPGKCRMRVPVLAAALLLGLGACSQASDRGPAGGCTPACGGLACGSPDGCGGSCAPGSGCTPGLTGHVVEGTPTQGSVDVASSSYRVRGSLGHGSSRTSQSTSYRIEQGALR
jgi:hypothetical protein